MDQWLSANLSFRKPVFYPWPADVGFMVDKIDTGTCHIWELRFYPGVVISPVLYTHLPVLYTHLPGTDFL